MPVHPSALASSLNFLAVAESIANAQQTAKGREEAGRRRERGGGLQRGFKAFSNLFVDDMRKKKKLRRAASTRLETDALIISISQFYRQQNDGKKSRLSYGVTAQITRFQHLL